MTPSLLRLRKLTEISFVDKGASGDDQHAARVVFSKRQEPTQSQGESMKVKKSEGLDNMVEQIKGALSEELQMVFDALLTAVASAGGAPAPEPEAPAEPEAEKADDEDEDEDEEIGKRADAQVKKQLDGALEQIAKLKAERRRDGFFAKAKGLKFVKGDVDQIAKALDEVDLHLSPESKAFVEGLIERVEVGLEKALTVHGSALGADDSSEIDTIAKEAAKAEGISFHQAYAKVARQRPDLYAKAKNAN